MSKTCSEEQVKQGEVNKIKKISITSLFSAVITSNSAYLHLPIFDNLKLLSRRIQNCEFVQCMHVTLGVCFDSRPGSSFT